MIVDSSALVAIAVQEPGFERLLGRVEAAPARGIGAPTAVEASMVLAARARVDGQRLLEAMLRSLDLEVLSFGEPHWREAVSAFVRYGKGRHPAALSFGDCLSYASASLAGRPLLYVGRDFSRTDIASA